MIKKIIISIVAAFACIVPAALPVYAVDITGTACKDISDTAICEDAKTGQATNPLFGKEGILTTVIGLLSFLVGVIAVIILIVTGIKFAINGSNPQEITKARNAIIYASVGIFLAALAQVIVQFVLKKL